MRLEILRDITDFSKDDIFKSKLEDAKYEYLRLVYPYDSEINELPNDKARNWQTKCAIELYRLIVYIIEELFSNSDEKLYLMKYINGMRILEIGSHINIKTVCRNFGDKSIKRIENSPHSC